MNEQTFKLLEKALSASPDDWETRAHLMDQYLAAHQPQRAGDLLKLAPVIPQREEDLLLKARVESELNPDEAMATLQDILSRNRACAKAYLLLAKLYFKRGLREEARKKYGAATVIDESLADPQFEALLGGVAAPEPTPAALQPAEPLKAATTGGGDSNAAVTEQEIAAALTALNEPEQPKISFDDIGGMQEVIERIRMNIIYPFKNPEVFRKYNKKPGGGILMYGPPGCGKTHIARATAGECGAVFIAIAITDILSKWVGESEQRLHQIFDAARRRAPAVIFIDEVDAIGVSRSDASSAMAPLVNVLLTELDGITAKNENLMILAATNTPWRVDSALRRPGRFDRVLFVPPPDETAREAILKIHLRDRPQDALDLKKIAKATGRFSGADLRSLVDRACEKAIYEEMRTGKAGNVSQKSLAESAKEMRPSTTEWMETARSYATYANRAGLYDDLVAFLENPGS
jgi:transitional endoplasmic reticulum ATPase